MTRAVSARLAGTAFLVYIAAGLIAIKAGETGAGKLLNLLETLCALTLAVTLYALTREVDADLALFEIVLAGWRLVRGGARS